MTFRYWISIVRLLSTDKHVRAGIWDGGWPLDLLQIWGAYTREGKGADLAQWLHAHLGSLEDGVGFGYADVLADADAWMLTKYMKEHVSEHSLSEAIKTTFSQSHTHRIARFYKSRFGGVADNVVRAFLPLLNGIDVGDANFTCTLGMLQGAANANTLPSMSEGAVLARAYAAFLANPHR